MMLFLLVLILNLMRTLNVFPVFFSSRRRHTRFDCDWSSDVCSSDLRDSDKNNDSRGRRDRPGSGQGRAGGGKGRAGGGKGRSGAARGPEKKFAKRGFAGKRSEERRVGKECRSRWSPDHLKKKTKNDN